MIKKSSEIYNVTTNVCVTDFRVPKVEVIALVYKKPFRSQQGRELYVKKNCIGFIAYGHGDWIWKLCCCYFS